MNIYKSQILENASQSKIFGSDLKNAKSFMKLEQIGLRGRITTAIKINLQQFEVLKNSLEEISFRFIAFLIKGFFLNLKKDYENFTKELDYFVENYISGVKIPKEKQIKKKRTKNETQKIVSLGNLSFFTQFSEFDKLFNEAFDEKKIAETLNKINKKLKDVDFSKLDDKTKKGYFRKLILEPLSESLPFTQIFNNFQDNLFTENPSSFAEYIDFDVGDSSSKVKNALKKKSKLKADANNAEIEQEPVDISALDNLYNQTEANFNLNKNNDTNLLNDVFFQDKNNFLLFNELVEVDQQSLNNLLKNYTFKNPYLRLDNEINWKIEHPNFNSDRASQKSQNSQSQKHAKLCEEAYLQFDKHFKKILINSHLEKLKKNLGIPISSSSLKTNTGRNKKADNKSNLERKLSCLIFESFEEEEEILKKIEQENFIPNDDMRLENNLFDVPNEINDFEISNFKFQENVSKPRIFINLEDANNSVFGSKNKSPELIDIYKQENSKSINESIQSLLLEELKESMNFSDIEFTKYSGVIKNNLNEFNLNTSEAMTLAFYNCLIVIQTNNFDVRQNKPFNGIYIVNF